MFYTMLRHRFILQNTIAIDNTCEDSLLAAPIMLDLVILCELCQRIKVVYVQFNSLSYKYQVKRSHESDECYQRVHSVV